ncbi:hypothetical protein D3C86_1032570 [compost metagenome]
MPKVKWWVKNKNQTAKVTYVPTTMEDILLDWENQGNAGSKFIKVTFGKSNYVEFIFYDMEKFQRSLRDHNPKEILIYDMYDLVLQNEYLGSETVKKMFRKVCNKYKIGKKRHTFTELLTLDAINEVMIEIDDFIEKYEEYALMDLF